LKQFKVAAKQLLNSNSAFQPTSEMTSGFINSRLFYTYKPADSSSVPFAKETFYLHLNIRFSEEWSRINFGDTIVLKTLDKLRKYLVFLECTTDFCERLDIHFLVYDPSLPVSKHYSYD
jgi:hypothetical protein